MIETEETLDIPDRSRSGGRGRDATPTDLVDSAATQSPHLVIRPTSSWVAINWSEMYDYRELLGFFIWRDISARYKQTILGAAWAVLQPLIMVVIFSFTARYVNIKMPMGLPYPVYIFAALIPWTMFSQGMPAAANSLVASLNMVTKVYFPRLFMPITAAGVFLVDGAISFLLYGGILFYYGITPQWTIVFLPFLFLLTLIATLSFGILLAGLTLFYRDFKHIVPFMVQIMMYVSGIFFPADMIPGKYRVIWALNPMFGIMDAFRAAILGTPLSWDCFLISSGVAIGLFTFSLYYFRRAERLFADYV